MTKKIEIENIDVVFLKNIGRGIKIKTLKEEIIGIIKNLKRSKFLVISSHVNGKNVYVNVDMIVSFTIIDENEYDIKTNT